MNRVLSFSSGKGGVGKTTIVANLGCLWAKQGRKVLLIDGDWSLGKLGITLGVKPKWNIKRVLDNEISIQEAIHPVSKNLFLLSSPTGLIGFEEMGETERNQMYFDLQTLTGQFDYVLIDHSSGLHWNVIQFAAAAHQHIIVSTPEPTSLTDAYAIIKILSKRFAIREFQLLITMGNMSSEMQNSIAGFCDVTYRQLQVRLQILELFPWVAAVSDSIRSQKPFVELFPDAPLTLKFGRICRKIDQNINEPANGLSFFYRPLETGELLARS